MENILFCEGVGKLLINPKTSDVAWAEDYHTENHLRENGYILMELITAILGVRPSLVSDNPCTQCQHFILSRSLCSFYESVDYIEKDVDLNDIYDDDHDLHLLNFLPCTAVDKQVTYTTVMAALRAAGPATQELIFSIASPKEMTLRLRHSIEYNLCRKSKNISGKLCCKGKGVLMIHPEDGDIVFLQGNQKHIYYKDEGYIPIDVLEDLYNVAPITSIPRCRECDRYISCTGFFHSFSDEPREPDSTDCKIVDLKATSALMITAMKNNQDWCKFAE